MTLATLYLYGGFVPFVPPPWISTNDDLRGGSSTSYLTPLPHNSALFAGHLDTTTLGGAGFAAQFSPSIIILNDKKNSEESLTGSRGPPYLPYTYHWDLSPYDGIEISLGRSDGKKYTLILKDETSPPPDEKQNSDNSGRAASLSWEAQFESQPSKDGGYVWLPWSKFEATYRGRPVKDEGLYLKKEAVRQVGFMMRSYFAIQQGTFELEIRSLCAKAKQGIGSQDLI